MKRFLLYGVVALVWAAVFTVINIATGRSNEAVVTGAVAAFLFGLAGMHCGRWWQR